MTPEGDRWQIFLATPAERLAYLRNAAALSDLTVTFPHHNTTIKAHRLVLAMSSPVFEAMLFGPLAEGDTLVLPEDPPSAFTWLLDHIYGGETHLKDVPLAIQVYHLAVKYQMDNLVTKCSQYLQQEVGSGSVAEVYQAAVVLGDDTLLHTCRQLLQCFSDEVLVSSSFPELSSHTLLQLLADSCLAIPSEVTVFTALQTWGEERVLSREDNREHITHKTDSIKREASTSVERKPEVRREIQCSQRRKAEMNENLYGNKMLKFKKKSNDDSNETDSLQNVKHTVDNIRFTSKNDTEKDQDSRISASNSYLPSGEPRISMNQQTGAMHNSSLRRELRPFLPYVRFLSMTTDQFVEHVMPSGVFTSEEETSILMNIRNVHNIFLPEGITSKKREPRMELQSINLVHCQTHSTPHDQEILRELRVTEIIYLTQVTAPGIVALDDAILYIKTISGNVIDRGTWQGVGCKFDLPVKLLPQERYNMVVCKAYGSCEGCGCDSFRMIDEILFCGKALAYTPVFLEFWNPGNESDTVSL